MKTALSLPLLCALAACSAPAEPAWRMVGVYDATTLEAMADPDGALAGLFAWQADPEMSRTCGPSGAPVGLGVTEAVAMTSRLTPTLAVLLRRESGGATSTLERQDVALELMDGDQRRRLEPAVIPRALRLAVNASQAGWEQRAVVQQVVTSLCLEHKLGRAWIGGGPEQVDEALLLDQRGADLKPDLYFVGQGAPAPALLGPERACMDASLAVALSRPQGLDSNSNIQPGDIWNANLPPCELETKASLSVSPRAPLIFGALPLEHARPWSTLTLDLELQGSAPTLAARLDDRVTLPRTPLETTLPEGRGAELSVPDVVGSLPRTYPTLSGLQISGMSTGEGGGTFTLLLVPAWQLLGPSASDGAKPGDEVGAVLADLSRLSVQVRDRDMWWEVNPHVVNTEYSRWSWGYPLGGEVAEGPLGAAGSAALTGASSADAYRAAVQGGTLASIMGLIILLGVSVRRLPDLWRRPPDLRLERWVERPPDPEDR